MRRAVVFALFLAFVSFAAAQDSIRWKRSSTGLQTCVPLKQRNPLHSHLAIEFATPPSPADLDQLREHGAVVLGPLSNRALIISARPRFIAPENATWLGSFAPENKISPLIHASPHASSAAGARSEQDPFFVVEFYLDVDMGDARSLAIDSGLQVIDNPDLVPNDLLVQGPLENVVELVSWDEVEYVFPASDDLVQGVPVNACAGALTSQGPVSQGVPTVGDGWDGPGRNAAALNYAFASVTEKLPADSAKSEIVRAFSEWAKYAKLTFTATEDTTASRTLAVLFARGAHGDAYPFQTTGTIAHTFYPAPLNPEPIAGDLHFNADENWQIGADEDLFSVALHETGHALGLGHSDNPADVMYPYYKHVTGIANGDITAILELYAAQDVTPPTAPPTAPPTPPLSVLVASPPATVNAAPVALSGTVTGGAGDVQVNWSNGTLSGVAQGSRTWVASVPLVTGANTIVITAADAQKNTAVATVTITRQDAPAPAAPTAIQIMQPAASDSYTTTSSAITISGAASDSSGIDRVTWVNSRGGSGQATGTTSWSAAPIPLLAGQNVITVTAYARNSGTASRSLTVSCTPAPPTPTKPGNDTTAPTLTILSPATTNMFTSATTIVFSGTASDNVGVASVAWSSSTGGSGPATGTTSWTTPPIPLLVGSNLITIRASDAAGNVGWRSVMVTRGQ